MFDVSIKPGAGHSITGHEPWLAPIELAAQESLPLWCDDVFLRALAAEHGVPSFGTLALLEVLIEQDVLADTLREDVQALVRANVVDLALTTEESLVQAAEDTWQPGATTTMLSRVGFWMHFDSALGSFHELARAVHANAPNALPTWVYAAVFGATANVESSAALARLNAISDSASTILAADDPLKSAIRKAAAAAGGARGIQPHSPDDE